jgi:ABC-type polysaccharide/polyol phosphate transport system ATPase subunit
VKDIKEIYQECFHSDFELLSLHVNSEELIELFVEIKLASSEGFSEKNNYLYFNEKSNIFDNDLSGSGECILEKGGRIQFKTTFYSGATLVDYLVKFPENNQKDIFIAYRYFGNDIDEEVVIRITPNFIKIGQVKEYQMRNSNAVLITLGRVQGCDVVIINGIPVFWKKEERGSVSGVVLDVINDGDDNYNFFLLYSGKRELDFYFSLIEEYRAIIIKVIEDVALSGDLSQLYQFLYSYDGMNIRIGDQTVLFIINKINTQKGYREYLLSLILKSYTDNNFDIYVRKNRPILEVKNLSLSVPINPLKLTLKDKISDSYTTRLLLNDICFKAFDGDVMGILGHNGAGKTTLFKTMAGMMPIDSGSIQAETMPVLLRPGVGMHPDLSGRDNIIKTALYMKILPQDVKPIIKKVIDFSGLEGHQNIPFKYYSDGMKARLVFSIATAISHDILLLDELLSAGDVGFQKKVAKRMEEFLSNSRVILVIQHTFDFIMSKCNKCLVLKDGQIVYYGDPLVAIEKYKESL